MSETMRLDPPIPVEIVPAARDNLWKGPIGKALAYAWIDPGVDEDLIWRVCFNEGGQWWDVPNPFVRGVTNITVGRAPQKEELWADWSCTNGAKGVFLDGFDPNSDDDFIRYGTWVKIRTFGKAAARKQAKEDYLARVDRGDVSHIQECEGWRNPMGNYLVLARGSNPNNNPAWRVNGPWHCEGPEEGSAA